MYTAKLVTIKESFTIPGKDRIIAVTLKVARYQLRHIPVHY